MTGFATAFSEIALVLFTALAPSGAVAYAIMGAVSFRLKGEERKRVNAALLIPFLVTLVGLVASATHLGNPDNALYVFLRAGASPLSNEVCAAVLFLGTSGLHWLYQFAEHVRPRVLHALLAAAVVSSLVFLVAVAFAYDARTVLTWSTPWVPVALCLNALVGGPVLAMFGLRFAKCSIIETRVAAALLAVSFAALVANVGVYAAQGASVLAMDNYLVSARQLVPAYNVMVAAFALLVVGGLSIDAAPRLRGRDASVATTAVAATMVLVGIFIMRFAFYMMHMTCGISM